MSDNEWKDAFDFVLRWVKSKSRRFSSRAEEQSSEEERAAFVGAKLALNGVAKTMREVAKSIHEDAGKRVTSKRRAAK